VVVRSRGARALGARPATWGEPLPGKTRARGDLPMGGGGGGRGLLAAVEIVRDQASREPYPASARMAQKIQAAALDRGAIVYASGGQANGAGDLIMLGPPLVIERAQIDEAIQILRDAIIAIGRA